jgi:hypothetical protein
MSMVQNCPMDIQQPLQLLGGLTPQQFMKRHWQKKPLLVRQAIPGFKPLLVRARAVRAGGPRGGGVAPGAARARGLEAPPRPVCAPLLPAAMSQPRLDVAGAGG